MKRSIRGTKKKGRPKTTGVGIGIQVRLHNPALAALDAWITAQPEPRPSRPEAIRRLVELGLSVPQPRQQGAHKGATTAADMAGEQINRMGDQSVTDEQRQSRKRRLLKGPKEFREDRRDQRRAKKG